VTAGAEPAAAGGSRPAAARELDRVAELWSELGDHLARIDPSFALAPGAGAQARALLRRLAQDPDTSIRVWDEAGDLPAFAIVRVLHPSIWAREGARAEIGDLFVREAWRRRGIGRALVRDALSWAALRGATRVEVRVAARNHEAQAFWRGLGFDDFVDVLERRL
jgi:GNAT superfamily N-acetyltransferase